MSTQEKELSRVSMRISDAILLFCRARTVSMAKCPQFYMSELLHSVLARTGQCAPASADRVLRLLRSQGKIEYAVDRGKSLYHLIYVEPIGGPVRQQNFLEESTDAKAQE